MKMSAKAWQMRTDVEIFTTQVLYVILRSRSTTNSSTSTDKDEARITQRLLAHRREMEYLNRGQHALSF